MIKNLTKNKSSTNLDHTSSPQGKVKLASLFNTYGNTIYKNKRPKDSIVKRPEVNQTLQDALPSSKYRDFGENNFGLNQYHSQSLLIEKNINLNPKSVSKLSPLKKIPSKKNVTLKQKNVIAFMQPTMSQYKKYDDKHLFSNARNINKSQESNSFMKLKRNYTSANLSRDESLRNLNRNQHSSSTINVNYGNGLIPSSKRKKDRSLYNSNYNSTNCYSKLDSLIESECKNVNSMNLDKKSLLLSKYINELQITSENENQYLNSICKNLSSLLETILMQYKNSDNINKYEQEVNAHNKTKKVYKDLLKQNEESNIKNSKLESEFDNLHDKYRSLYSEYEGKVNTIQKLVSEMNEMKKDLSRFSDLEAEVNYYKDQYDKLKCKLKSKKNKIDFEDSCDSLDSLASLSSKISINSHMLKEKKSYNKHSKIPNLNLSQVSIESDTDETQDLDQMIESAIEMEMQENPGIANEFDNIEDFKRYIFDKYFQDYNQNSQMQSHKGELSISQKSIRSNYPESYLEGSIRKEEDFEQDYVFEDIDKENNFKEFNNKPSVKHSLEPIKLKKEFKLDMQKTKGHTDYQDEFMANYDNFSESWRKAIEKNKKF